MATTRTDPQPQLPAFTQQERHTLRQLGAIVGVLDDCRRRCAHIERSFAACPEGPRRQQLLRDLFAARQQEERTVNDLRDGVCHLAGLVRPLGVGSRS